MEQKYSSQIKDMGLLKDEMKVACQEFFKCHDFNDIVSKSVSENIFGATTIIRRKKIANKIVSRMEVLDDFVLEKIASGDEKTSALLCLYAVLKSDRLFCEFMDEVVREKLRMRGFRLISDDDFDMFFTRKSMTSDVVAGWKPLNKNQLRYAMKRILEEAGIISTSGKVSTILTPVLDSETKLHLIRAGEAKYLEMLCVQ